MEESCACTSYSVHGFNVGTDDIVGHLSLSGTDATAGIPLNGL
jgi:hypothetical protein